MVPGQLSLSEREQNQRADRGLQEETAAALHSSYDQWDPCGEGEQLQVPRCKHLRGPDMDYTHPNHPGNHLFILLPSGKRFRSMMAKTERLRRSFFPQAIRLLNSVS